MNSLVKIIQDENGEKIVRPKWHLIVLFDGSPRTFCSGEAFGFGESSVVYETKEATRGITCDKCKDNIRRIKKAKL